MYEFRWTLPGKPDEHDIQLRILARNGWIGRKILLLDGNQLYTRGWFGGINHTFPHPEEPNRLLTLQAVPAPKMRCWQPQLTLDDAILPERTGNPPPPVPRRTRLLGVVTGLTYLIMLMVLIMLPHVWRMLQAGFGHSDTRIIVLEVAAPEPTQGPTLGRQPFPEAVQDRPYEASITVEGGLPPYEWARFEGKMPHGLSLSHDESAATIHGTPVEAGASLVWLRVTDASGAKSEWPCVISVLSAEPGEPSIQTHALPAAREGTPYTATLQAVGGTPFEGEPGDAPLYHWVINKRKLPKGLRTDRSTGEVSGTPQTDTAGPYPLTVRVFDNAYTPFTHVAPWIAPFAATAVCLLGFWNMRRWSVILYAALILAQLVVGVADVWHTWLPLNATGLILQTLVFAVGARSYTTMR